jgi:hypothetical protein
MAFQAALCLVFASPKDLEVTRDELFESVQNNIQNSNFGNEDKLPKLHVKLCEMSLHVFKSAILNITVNTFAYLRQSSRDIVATLHNEDVTKEFYSYKICDAIKAVHCLERPNNVDILEHIHNVAYVILRKYKGKGSVVKEIKTYEEIKLFAGGVNEFVDSYDLIYSKSLELSNLTSAKAAKDFSEIKSHTTKKARLDDIFSHLVSVASPKEKAEKSPAVLQCAKEFRDYLWRVSRNINVTVAADSNISRNVNNDIAADTTISSNCTTPTWKKLLGTIGKKHQTFSSPQINLFMRGMKAFLEENKESNPTIEDSAIAVADFLKKIPGYQCIRKDRLIKWYRIYSLRENSRNKWVKRRKSTVVNYDFESCVWSKLIWVELMTQINPDGTTTPIKNIRGNIAVSYGIIRRAAEETKREPAFRLDRRVQSLKFSNKWIRLFLNRNKFTKKKINSKHKANFPSDADINTHLEQARRNLFCVPESNQSFMRNGPMKPSPDQIVNYDETAWHMTIDLQYLYSPTGVGRTLAPQGGNDARERITCIPTLLANGKLGPCMMILKDSSSMGVADQTSMTVLDKCLQHLGARGSEWESGVYSVTLTKPKCRKRKRNDSDNNEAGNNVTPRNNNVPSSNYSDDNEEKLDYKINYLRHKENGHIICSQSKAYNDSLRQCLFIDLILRNIQRKSPGNLLFVWSDNLGTHKTEEINAKYISNIHNQYSYIREPSHDTEPPRGIEKKLLPDIRVGYLPPNTTAYLQPCDLLLNSLIKAFGRQLRNDLLYNDFQEWCKKMDELRKSGEYDQKQNYFFETSKVDYKQRLFELIDFYDNNLISQLSQDTVEKCFIDSGLAPITKDPLADPAYWEKNYSASYGGASYKLIDISSKQKNVDVPIMPIKVDYEDYDESSIPTIDQVDQLLREQDDEDRDDTEAVDLGDELSDIGDTFEPYIDDEGQYTDGSDDEDNT